MIETHACLVGFKTLIIIISSSSTMPLVQCSIHKCTTTAALWLQRMTCGEMAFTLANQQFRHPRTAISSYSNTQWRDTLPNSINHQRNRPLQLQIICKHCFTAWQLFRTVWKRENPNTSWHTQHEAKTALYTTSLSLASLFVSVWLLLHQLSMCFKSLKVTRTSSLKASSIITVLNVFHVFLREFRLNVDK